MIPRMSRRRWILTAGAAVFAGGGFGLYRMVRKVNHAAAHTADL